MSRTISTFWVGMRMYPVMKYLMGILMIVLLLVHFHLRSQGAKKYSSCSTKEVPDFPYVRPSKFIFPLVSTPFVASTEQCKQAFVSVNVPSRVDWPPPCPAPSNLVQAYERHGMPITRSLCFAQRYEGAGDYTLDWNLAYMTKYCSDVATGTSSGSYNAAVVEQVRHAMQVMGIRKGSSPSLSGTVGLVIGSETPWVECLALNFDADTVWTWEYGRIISNHPRIKARPYKDMAVDFASGNMPLMDWVATFSSLEHSGMGRYGDPLNPDGDAEALQQAYCMLKPGGVLLLGLPSVCRATGYIEFNAHRVYGYERLAFIAKDFELLGFTDACGEFDEFTGRIVLLRKPEKPTNNLLSVKQLHEASYAPLQSKC